MGKPGLLLASLAALLVLIAPAAEAATVEVDPDRYGSSTIAYRSGPGEQNDVVATASRGARRIVLSDAGATIEAGEGCRRLAEGDGVSCRPPKPKLPEIFEDAIKDGELPPEIVEEILQEIVPLVGLNVVLAEGDDRVDTTALPEHLDLGGEEAELYPFFKLGDGADVATFGPAEDAVVPGAGDDDVDLGEGGDYVIASRGIDGTDSLDGGLGEDFLDYSDRVSSVSVALGTEAGAGRPGEGDSAIGFEAAMGGRGDDRLTGDAGSNFIIGRHGDDELIGAGGADRLRDDGSRHDVDVLRGGPGPDRIAGGGGHDALLGGGGSDHITSSERFIFQDGGERDQVNCGSGRDEVRAKRKDRLHGCEQVTRIRPIDLGKLYGENVSIALRAPGARNSRLYRLAHPLGQERVGVLTPRFLRRHPELAGYQRP